MLYNGYMEQRGFFIILVGIIIVVLTFGVGGFIVLQKSGKIVQEKEKPEQKQEDLKLEETTVKTEERKVEEELIPVQKKQTSNLPPPTYLGSRYMPRTISRTTQEWETQPSFFWSTPYYSEPAIKGYWVSIDSLTEWTLVKPPTGKNWRSPKEIADGTHTFRIKAEYGDGKFGEAGSIYFDISTQFPDITIGEITWEKLTLFRGGPSYEVEVSAVIKNDSNKDFIGVNSTVIRIYLDAPSQYNRGAHVLQTLFAGEEKKITFRSIYLSEGEYELQVVVDELDIIKESDETNNERTVTIIVGE